MNPEKRLLQIWADRAKLPADQQSKTGENIDEVVLPPDIPAAQIKEKCDKLITRPNDVFVVTLPKSGTTWIQQIVKLILTNGKETGVDIDVFAPFLDAMSLEEAESMDSPRVFKSHLPYKLLPEKGEPRNSKAKYIYGFRNPKDVVTSWFKFISPEEDHDKMLQLPWDVFFQLFSTVGVVYGPFHDHILGWWTHRDASNILIVSYEQMKRDPCSAVSSIATFLGYNLTNDVIGKIVTETSFDKMKDNKAANKNSTYENYNPRINEFPFMRKGIIGDWKNLLTQEQSSKIDAIVAEKMKDSGIVFDYGDEQ